MKRRTTILTFALLPSALLTLTSCSSTAKAPPADGTSKIKYTKGVPGGVVTQTFKITATITAVEVAKRKATLLKSDGKTFIVKIGPEVVNLDQLRVGDQVTATLTETIIARLDEKGTVAVAGATKVVAENTQLTGEVLAIDSIKRTATIRFDDGTTQTFPIREDVDLSRRNTGEQIVLRVTDVIAIKVEKLR